MQLYFFFFFWVEGVMFFSECKWGEPHLRVRAPSSTACAYTCRARHRSCGIQEAVFGLSPRK